jgi:hypothetical protein
MLRVLACVALFLSGCAFDPPPEPIVHTKIVTRVVKEYVRETKGEVTRVACPTDDQIRAAAVEASRWTYLDPNRPTGDGSGDCPCRRDKYTTKAGVTRQCGETSAEAKNAWVMCDPKKVPDDLVEKIKAGLTDQCRAP